MSKEIAQTVRSKKIGALVAIIAVIAVVGLYLSGGTVHAQTATNDAVVTISHGLAATNIDTNGVDTVHPPGLASSPFPGTWATIESTRNSVTNVGIVNHPPGFAPVAVVPGTWNTIESSNSVVTNVESAGLMRDSQYVIVASSNIVGQRTFGAANSLANPNITDTIGSNTSAGTTSVFGVDIIALASSPVATIVVLALFATLFASVVAIVASSIARTMRASQLPTTTRRPAHTNANNRWLIVRLATQVIMIASITDGFTRAGQAIKNAPRELHVKRFDMRAAGHLGFPFA